MRGNSWLEFFRREPDQAVCDLFDGGAGVPTDPRLDVPEFLYRAFPPNLVGEREQLDAALLNWLDTMRNEFVDQVDALGFSVYGKRIGDALMALQFLDLPYARDQIRAELDKWLRWLLPLRLAPERDPALECYRLLTQGQPDSRHVSTWLRLAGDQRPEYLTVALAGIQLLPDSKHNEQANHRLMLRAVLSHAVSACHDVQSAILLFDEKYAALQGLFLRSHEYWKQRLQETLKDFAESSQDRLATELVQQLRKETIS